MSNKICVYTCITGDYDNLHEIEYPEKNIDYFCFTNNPKLTSKTWQIIPINDSEIDNHRIARKIKTIGHPMIKKYKIAVWTDANIIWQTHISDFVKTYFKNNSSLAIFKHHARTTVYDEAIECLKMRKDKKESIVETLHYLESNSYPDNNGLCESTVFIKNPNDQKVIETMQIWFNIINSYSLRDQLSFNYAAWKTKLNFNYINLNVWNNNWFCAAKHNYNPKIDSCHVYYGDMSKNFNFDKYFIYPYKIQNDIYKFNTTIPCNTKKIELNITNLIGFSYHDIKINPQPNNIEFQNFYLYNNDNLTTSTYNSIHLYSDFKKNQKFSFAIKITPAKTEIISNYIEYQSVEFNSLLKQYQETQQNYLTLEKQSLEYRTELSNILNCKGWKALETTRKIIHPFNK